MTMSGQLWLRRAHVVSAVLWLAAVVIALRGWPILGLAFGMFAVVVVATTTPQHHPQYHFTVWVLMLVLLWAVYDGAARRRIEDERNAYYAYRTIIGCGDYDGDGRIVRNNVGQPARKDHCADPDSVLQTTFREAMK